ncbi:sensor histidine kinase [Actinomycetospora succinea]|uniref:sensor histidine kinase n=1 Tax=Actinomycetospora succinea TaxID=663603 RepID=UPI001FB8043D|nr:sensor histidine kinase [Actinomycetospora succinea]
MPADPVTRRWPWAVAGLAAALVVIGIPLAVANAAEHGVAGVYVVDAVIGGLVPVAGALVLTRAPRHRVGLVLLSTAGLAVSFVLAEWAGHVGPTVPASWARWISEITWVPFLAIPTLLPLWFPTGRVPSRRWRPLQALVLTLLGALVVVGVLQSRLEDGTASPLGLGLPVDGATAVLTLATLVSALACLASAVVRYRGAPRADRRSLRRFVVAVALLVVLVFLPGVPIVVGDLLMGIGVVIVAGTVAAAVLDGLPGLDVAVDRTVVAGLAAATCSVLYVVVVAAAGAWVPDAAGFLGVAAVAVAFAPLREVAARGVRRFVHGPAAEPLTALASVTARLDGPLAGAAEAVRAGAALDGVAVLDREGIELARAGTPPAPGAGTAIPMVVAGATVGTLRVTGDRSADPLLTAFARTLGATLHASALVDELQAAREGLVLAAEEERRRLHHDLHDGLGPVLAHAVLGLDGVRVAADPAVAAELDAVKAGLRAAIADLRHLVHGLRPPALDELGLAGALAEHARRAAGPRVVLDLDEVPADLPAAVEVATYRIVCEALANAARHAGASRCDVTIAATGGELAVEVRDDGVGFEAAAGEGVGLGSIRRRAAELGGTTRLTSVEGGGARVAVRIPLREPVAEPAP